MAKGFTEKRTSSSDDSGSDDAGSSLQFSHADTAKFAAMVKKNGEIACPGKVRCLANCWQCPLLLGFVNACAAMSHVAVSAGSCNLL